MAAHRQVVLPFTQKDEKSLSPRVRGGKGAGLVRLVDLGLPVPPGFTLSTTVSRAFQQEGRLPKRVAAQLEREIKELEKKAGKGFGNPKNPLLVSVRSGAAVSMPGMMDTVLNVGINRRAARSLGKVHGKQFAKDCSDRFRDAYREISGSWKRPSNDPMDQLYAAIEGVLRSWNSERAVTYRESRGIPHWEGTAVTVQAMVFGNLNDCSCTGVVFSHDPATGNEGLCGEFLVNAQGEDVVSGSRTPLKISEMEQWNPQLLVELQQYVDTVAEHFDDMVDVEFTVEDGKLYLLQARAAKRTPFAAATFAVRQVWAKRWTHEEAIKKASENDVREACQSHFLPEEVDEALPLRGIAAGNPASPGAAVGQVVRSSALAVELAAQGHSVILVRSETSPEDLPGMLASAAIITERGGSSCHAAVVARELGLPAVVGIVTNLDDLDYRAVVSVCGDRGVVIEGQLTIVEAERAKEVNIFLRWVERYTRKPRIGFEWEMERMSANQLINDFYLTESMSTKAIGTRLESRTTSLKRKVHRQAAEILACYLAIAVAGELRHAKPWELSSVAHELSELTRRYALKTGARRERSQESILNVLKGLELSDQADFFDLAAQIFSASEWDAAFGGQNWAAIARAPELYLKGAVSDSVFVDHAFDLRHNGGRLFDKHSMFALGTDESATLRQLDAKRNASSPEKLRSRLLNWADFSQEVEELWQEGHRQNIW